MLLRYLAVFSHVTQEFNLKRKAVTDSFYDLELLIADTKTASFFMIMLIIE